MALPEFDFALPLTLGETLGLLGEQHEGTVLMSGGTDLVVQMKQGVKVPKTVVCLSGVTELKGIKEKADGTMVIGGGTSIATLEADELLRARCPGIVDAARSMATPQVRNRATVAGNLATAAACADLPPILRALGASIVLRRSDGSRTVKLEDFFTGARTTVLRAGEVITAVEIPPQPENSGSAFEKYGYRRGAQVSVASAGAHVVLVDGIVREATLVLGAVAPVPLPVQGVSAILDKCPEGPALDAVCAAASAESKPISDIRGSELYRRAIVAVVARTALLRAVERARSNESPGELP